CEVSTTYHGVDWDMVGEDNYQWPIPYRGHPGTPRLHEDGFINGRGIFKLINYRDPSEVIDDDYPVWLTTGRRLETYHSRTQTGRSQGIDYLASNELLEVNPDDVDAWGLEDGGLARVASRRGEIVVQVRATTRSPRGTVFASFSYADVPVNTLTGGGYDPVTDTAELKVCPVRVEPHPETPERRGDVAAD
ncbi:MAG: formate dehydrogenase subunit alpha, partial [Gemmatimonadetes bacterium]|nr:formate dehydrogenase subunit alpha [Gemmatimonadota bacterium]